MTSDIATWLALGFLAVVVVACIVITELQLREADRLAGRLKKEKRS